MYVMIDLSLLHMSRIWANIPQVENFPIFFFLYYILLVCYISLFPSPNFSTMAPAVQHVITTGRL